MDALENNLETQWLGRRNKKGSLPDTEEVHLGAMLTSVDFENVKLLEQAAMLISTMLRNLLQKCARRVLLTY